MTDAQQGRKEGRKGRSEGRRGRRLLAEKLDYSTNYQYYFQIKCRLIPKEFYYFSIDSVVAWKWLLLLIPGMDY